MAYVIDTNVLLSGNVENVLKNYEVIIPSIVLREIEILERKKGDRTLQFEIRRAKRTINKYLEEGNLKVDHLDYRNAIDDFDESYADNIILAYALENNHALITNDILMRLKAKGLSIETVSGDEKGADEKYQGFITEVASKEELIDIYRDRYNNIFKLLTNQYAVILDNKTAKVSDVLKWDGEMLISLGDRRGELVDKFSTLHLGSFRTKDVYQLMAVDSIRSNQVTTIRGKAGSGKSLIALSVALQLMEKDGYKLVLFCNPTPSKDAQELGFRKGDTFEKLMQSSVGVMMKSKLGGEEAITRLIAKDMLDILPFSDLRGYDTGEQKTVIWIVEAQNLTVPLLKLGLQRITESAKVIIDGDDNAQVDKDIYENDNGMKRVSEVLRGNELYGEVELQNVWRSRLAELVDIM